MPHLTIDYSQNTVSNFDALCVLLHGVLLQSGLFELGAIRVRARACPQYAVADRLPENAFADMILRIGKGRSDAEKQAVGAALMQAAEAHFAPLLARPHFALSLEVQ